MLGVITQPVCRVDNSGRSAGLLRWVGREVSLDDAYKSAQIAALNCLAEAKAVLGT